MKHSLSNGNIIFTEDGITGTSIYKCDKYEIINMHIPVAKELSAHKVPFEAAFYIMSGEGIITLNSQEIEVKQNDVIIAKENVQRGIKNTGKDDLEITVYKTI